MRAGLAIGAALIGVGVSVNPVVATAQDKVTVAIAVKALSFAPVYLAIDGGMLSKRNIKAETVMTAGGIQPMAAVLAGDAQFAASADDVIMAMANTKKFTAIYTLINSFTQQLNARKETVLARKVTHAMPWRERIRALKGITMGALTLGGSSDLAGRWLWKEAGLDPANDMTVVKIGALPALVSAMKQGSIDSFVLSSPARELIERQGVGEAIVRFEEVEAWAEEPAENINVLKEFVTTHRDLAKRFVAGIAEAQKMLYDDPAGSAAILHKGSFAEVDQALIESALRNMHIAFRHELMTQKRWDNAIKSHAAVNPKLESVKMQEGADWTNELYPEMTR